MVATVVSVSDRDVYCSPRDVLIRFAISFCYLCRITVGSCTELIGILGIFLGCCNFLLRSTYLFLISKLNITFISIGLEHSCVGFS